MSETTYFTTTLPEAFDHAGLPFPGPAAPGKFVRFSTNAKDRTDRAGWLSMLPDGLGAAFGDWRSGESFCWQMRDTNDNPPSQEEREKARQAGEKARIQAEEERAKGYSVTAAECSKLWAAGQPAPHDFAYLVRKGIKPNGAKLSHDGRMMLPVHGADGEIQSLQYISTNGEKRFHPGGKMQAGWCLLGTARADEAILLCEGYATASSLHQATGKAVFCAFNAGNLLPIAKMLQSRYPAAVRLICGDDDRHTIGNPGRTKATEAAAETGASVVFPTFADPDGSDFNDMASQTDIDAVRKAIEGALKPPESLRYKLLTDCDLSKLPPLIYRIKNVLPSVGVAAVYGASGSGKSFLVLDMLQSLAAGADWFGRRATACPVICCALEGEGGIAGRVNAYRIRHGTAAENIRYLVQPFSLLQTRDIEDLAKAIEVSGGAGVVVLDTLNRAAPGADENDSKAMGQIIAGAKQLQTLVGGLVLLIHHVGKDATKGMRGHSSLHAALDCAIEVRRDGDRREWLIAKSKDGEDGESHPFKLDVVELGVDEDGEPVTSCVVHPVDDVGDHIRKALPPKSGNQKAIWDAMGEMFRKAGDVKPKGAPDALPSGRPCVTLEHAIEQTRTRLVCEPKRQTERCQAAIRGLVERGLLCHQEGFLWCN